MDSRSGRDERERQVIAVSDPSLDDFRSGYDSVASEYAEKFFRELEHKPLDRALLERLARESGALGPICDLGCGPGQIARFLKDHGADVLGVDLSPQMVAVARRSSPDIPFLAGNLLELDFPDCSWGGVAAFYSLIHIPRQRLPEALGELRRVLKEDGLLLIAFHVGEETVHLAEFFGKPVNLDFHFLQPDLLEQALCRAGFQVLAALERDPYPEEHRSRRGYLLARKA